MTTALLLLCLAVAASAMPQLNFSGPDLPPRIASPQESKPTVGTGENSLRSSIPPSQFVPAREAQVVKFDRLEPTADGNAGVAYETNHGVKVIERIRPDAEGFNTYTGSYSYFDSEGTPVVVTYVADRDGYYATVPIPANIPPHAAEQIRRGQAEHEKARRLFAQLRRNQLRRS